MDQSTIDFICNILRQGTVKWSGRSDCLKRARTSVQEGFFANGNPKYKYYWKCSKCSQSFRNEKDLEVDHIVEIGPYRGDLHDYASRMYCGQENLQCLCVICHSKKTNAFNAALRYSRK